MSGQTAGRRTHTATVLQFCRRTKREICYRVGSGFVRVSNGALERGGMRYGNQPRRVAEYILHLADLQKRPLTPMQILKLVYIAHGWLLGIHGRPLVNEPIEAWPYGPVIPSLYQHFKKFGSRFIDDFPADPPSGFDMQETETMRDVMRGYGDRSGISLSALTHEPGTPWAETVRLLGSGAVISNDLIEDYYHRLAIRPNELTSIQS